METESFREQKPCPICKSKDYDIKISWNKDYYNHNIFETSSWDGRQSINLRIVKCKNCGLIYSNPSFKRESLHYVYPEDLISTEKRSKSELMKDNKWQEIIEIIDKYLTKGSCICDVGTRYGILVEKLKQKEYNPFGIELNPKSVEYARKNNIDNVFLSSINELDIVIAKLGVSQVNGFIMDDVLEHLVDPIKELRILSSFQRPGDYFFLRQMNHNSFGRKLYRKNWYYYQPAAHMCFFDELTIEKMLNNLNYEIILIKKTSLIGQVKPFIIQLLRFMGVNRYLMPPQVNGKKMYLDKRAKLNDMYLVVAKKK